jgi:hypothetical protein
MTLIRWGFACALAWLLAPGAQADVRVALVTLERGEIAQGVLDLATASLSAEPGVVLLERAEIDRLFEEQERSRALAGDESLALRAGRLLVADVLGVVEFDASASEALGLVVFDARTGARLWDATLPPGMGESVEMITFGLERALLKRNSPSGAGGTVCILTVRNENLPEENNPALEGIGRLVERKLTSSERLSVLERQRLGFLNEERETAGATPALPGAMTLAELSFRQGTDATGVEAAVRLTDVGGAVLREQRFPARNLDAWMAGEMSAWMCDALSGGCISPQASPEREAEHFLRESVFWFGYYPAHVDKALRAAEAAHALDPASPAIREQLVAALLQSQMPWELRMRYMRRAVDLQDGLVREGYYREVDRSRLIGASGAHCRYECHMWQALKKAVSAAIGYSDFNAAVAEICRRHRDTMREINRQRLATVQSAQTFNRYLQWFNFYVSKTHEIWARSGKDWTDETIALCGPVFDLAREHPLYGSRDFEVNRIFLRLTTKTRQFDREPEAASVWRLEPADLRRLAEFCGTLAEHPNPLIALYGRLGHGLYQRRLEEGGESDFRERFAAVRDFGLAAIDAAREDGRTPAFRAMLYQATLDAIDSLPDLHMRREERQALFDFMIEHGEFVHTVEETVTQPDVGPFAAYASIGDSLPYALTQGGATVDRPTRIANMRRALETLADPESTVLRGSREVARSSLQARLIEVGELPEDSGSAPWSDVVPLLGPDGPSGNCAYSRAFHRDGKVYVAELREEAGASEIALATIELSSGRIERSGSVRLDGSRNTPYARRHLGAAVLGDRHFYVGTASSGIVEFPLAGGGGRRFSSADGLPSDAVQALAVAGTRLFAGLGEYWQATYFVEIDVASGTVALRGSSLRRTVESPVDNASPQPFFGDMHVDRERNRLYFLLHESPVVLPCDFRGLWSLDLETGEYVQRARFTRNLHRLAAQPDGSLYVMDDSTIVRYRPEEDSVQLVYTVRQDPPVGPGLSLGSAEVKERYWMIAPFAFENDTIWSGRPFSRLRVQKRRHDVLPPPDPRLKRPSGRWHGMDYLPDQNALLASLDNGVWLLKLKPRGAAVRENPEEAAP